MGDPLDTLAQARPSFLDTPNRNAGGLSASEGSIAARWEIGQSAPHSHYQAPFPELTTAAGTLVNAACTPFYVTLGNKNGQHVAAVCPGKIAGIVPTIYGLKLDDKTPQVWFLQNGNSSIFLKATITADDKNSFASNITAVEITDDNVSGADINPATSELDELTVIWDDPTTRMGGHFYIRVADIDTTKNKSIQWLYDNYTTFVVGGDVIAIIT